ncbi:MAG: hypothetical protein AAFU64_06785, partial [Bacteroidota bacterium]
TVDTNQTESPENYKILLSKIKQVGCGDSVGLGTLTLPIGSYIIEKVLTPSEGYNQALSQAIDEVGDLTTPLVNMISSWLEEVKCSDQLEGFYQRVDSLSKGLNGCFDFSDPDNPTIVGGCDLNTSNLEDSTYLSQLDHYYQAELGLVPDTSTQELKPFFTIFHKVFLRRYFDLTIYTPECSGIVMELPLSEVIDPKTVQLIDRDADLDYKVNPFVSLDRGFLTLDDSASIKTEFYPDLEGLAYGFFWECTPLSQAEMEQELNVLFSESDMIEDIQRDLGARNLTEVKDNFGDHFYIHLPDEAFLNKKIVDDTTEVREYLGVQNADEALLKIIYIHYKYLHPHMQGWHQPGTFNLMVHHMLKDSYNTNGLDNDSAEVAQLVYEGPLPKNDACGETMALTDGTFPRRPGAEETELAIDSLGASPQYYAEDLLYCWETQLSFIQAIAGQCPNDPILDSIDYEIGKSPSDQFDEQNDDDESVHDDHFDDGIKLGWFLRIFLGRKIKKASQKARSLQVAPGPEGGRDSELDDEPYYNINYNYHAVAEFLNCTDYKFAKILTPTDPLPLSSDFDANYELVNALYKPRDSSFIKYQVPSLYLITDISETNTWKPYQGKDRQYHPNGVWQEQLNGEIGQNRNPLVPFEYIKDPVYAFKYFEYPYEVTDPDTVTNQYRRLEIQTCYKDYDQADTCNVCGFGIVKCQVTRPN